MVGLNAWWSARSYRRRCVGFDLCDRERARHSEPLSNAHLAGAVYSEDDRWMICVSKTSLNDVESVECWSRKWSLWWCYGVKERRGSGKEAGRGVRRLYSGSTKTEGQDPLDEAELKQLLDAEEARLRRVSAQTFAISHWLFPDSNPNTTILRYLTVM